ncbi:hypothetical protein Poli38472_010067 [Pythium oligandrum]|uniref:Cilia- and flagella-associated protein 45 n=1 Tax=Pythium oligandrum TaxID=41045 RepID=A0A8K1C982_PYTOL|nr:hypothetical protein Poli38472_010067 [Pythium oligandrum]|eukprot:TMW58508.1 hypothetical protein Poli38472_010067 [Pythium oligandrum]
MPAENASSNGEAWLLIWRLWASPWSESARDVCEDQIHAAFSAFRFILLPKQRQQVTLSSKLPTTMRAASATSRGSVTTGSQGSSTSRRYRRIAHSPQVDDTLFGSSKNAKPLTKSDRTRQAGRDIVGGGASNNQEEPSTQPVKRHGHRAPSPKRPTVVVGDSDLHRIKNETKIYTAVELEELQARRDAELEQMRLTSKARKEHMLKLSEEAALRAPKSQIEQILDTEKQEVIRKAKILKDQAHDSVKLIRTLGARAQAFTIRDQQKKMKEELDDEHHVYDEKMNMLMEVERLEGLKRQEEIDEAKKAKRYADRKVLEGQISDRRREREKESELVAQEAAEMLAKIKKQQEEEAEKERLKAERAQLTMDEIKKFNEISLNRKMDEKRKQKEEEDKVLAYQLKKAEEQRQLEEEEARKRHEAELRCAKLRSMQEKMANEKAELDELRAKRAAEARERQAREAEVALLRKHKQEMEELRRARGDQALHRQRARIKEAVMQQQEYESIMAQVENDKQRVKENEEKKKLSSYEHRRVLQQQIEEKEKLKKDVFVKKQIEGQELKEEFTRELEKLEQLRLQEVEELVKAGVNPLYLSEMKAVDIERIRNR